MKRRILIVEDELGARRLMEYLLGAYYQVASVTNGREAIHWLDDGNEVDLIISDVEMPQMTGLEMVAYMQEKPLYSAIPYILVSSRDRSSIEQELSGLRDINYLNKPLQPKTLYWKVEELLMNSVSY
ncbi:MAG: response regulator [Roseivirga sp.]|nr:response regulator [Roseivirga sp.]